MIIPPPLQPGDTIGIVSTARKITPGEINPAITRLEQWGFKCLTGKTIGAQERQFAGDDALRAGDLQCMLEHPEVKAILCARGGYGTVRIIDRIDFKPLIRQPKWIVGYSDITALHAHLNNVVGIASIHGTMPLNFQENTTAALESLKCALTGLPIHYTVPYHPANIEGTAEGRLFGGNLSVLYSLLGSPSISIKEKIILFLEDLDEYLYHIDRMMMALMRSGLLLWVNGVVAGHFTDIHDNEIPFGKTVEEILLEYFQPLGVPVCFDFPAGHIADNRALIMGLPVRLSVNKKATSLTMT